VGVYDKEIPSQRTNHSPDLPGNWLRHSLRRRMVAPAIGVLMALIFLVLAGFEIAKTPFI